MTKISYYILLFAPIGFLTLSLISAFLVGLGGHSSGDSSTIDYLLIVFSIGYFIVIKKRLKNQKNRTINFLSVILTLFVLGISVYYAYVSTVHSTGLLFDIVLMLLTYIFTLCSIIVMKDIIKSILQ